MTTKTQSQSEPVLTNIDHHGPNSLELFPLSSRQSQSRGHQELPSSASSIRNHDAIPALLPNPSPVSMLKKVTVVAILSGLNFTTSGSLGLVEISLPIITTALNVPKSLSFWPASISTLTTASTLLLAGSVADIFGARIIELIGAFIVGALMVGCGFARTGSELVGMRAVQGVGYAMHLASSVALVTQTLKRGRGRNVAFACLGISQCLGFSFGLVAGGILLDKTGWRTGWYLLGGISIVFAMLGVWVLPAAKRETTKTWGDLMKDVKSKVDWVGALLASAFMALLSYLLAVLSTDISKIQNAESIVLLCFSVATAVGFLCWVHFQVQYNRPALIPNKLWKSAAFSSVCGTIALSFAVVNAMELFANLYFQEVQHLSALQASLRIVPSLVVGMILNLTMGFFVDRVPPLWIVVLSSLLCAVSPLLMAITDPKWTYWANPFVAQLLQPLSVDALFTVGLIVITEVFPEDTQALAGAVFNTTAQFGSAFGLAVMQIVSTLVTKGYEEDHGESGEVRALLEGYRASFWTMFGFMILCGAVGWLGLRRTGKIGLKQD